MQIDVIDPKTQKPLRTLDVDPGGRAFGVIAAGRIVYIHEDDAGELIFKCLQY
jgi:prophage tail gpP-like protein